jgi:GNAT superfamily N-acetyltransferase
MESGDLVIRPITAADTDPAASLSAELGYPVDGPTMASRIRQLGAAADHAVFVACRSDRVLGWVHVATVHHMQAEPRAEIGGLVVSADARRQGIGARLVARAEQWAQERGLTGILVRSQIMREDAHRFYLREGYARTKTSAVFSKELRRSGSVD